MAAQAANKKGINSNSISNSASKQGNLKLSNVAAA